MYTPGAMVKLGKERIKYGYEKEAWKLDQQVEVH